MDAPTPTTDELVPDDACPQCGRAVGDAWLVCAWCGAQIAAPAELAAGSLLSDGRYQVLGVIGRGGFGITYEVLDTRLHRSVAVKELFPDSAVRHGSMVLTPPQQRPAFRASRERFLREARVLARFTHPGIVRVYEVFEEHGTAYLVMERLSGRTLVDVLRARRAPFEPDEVLDVAGRVAAALRPVHAAGVLHRDVNPSNVMLTEHGRIVVIDFGLARDFDPGQTMGMTRMVTPGYAPLEQYRGEARFGPPTDVYGLAATCYRLATGRVPVAALERDAGAALPSPRSLNGAVPKEVSDAILDGLELEPGHRPADLDSFLARLGIRHLPDSPRSILLGRPGAEPADLAPPPLAPPVVEPAAPAAPAPPTGPTELLSPGPAQPARTAPAEPPRPVPPSPAPEVDPDATMGAPASLVAETVADPDRTAVPAPAWTAAPAVDPAEVAIDGAAPSAAALGPPPGRRLATIPLAVLAVALGSAAPLLGVGVIVLLVLPALATVGDAVAQRHRSSLGVEPRWAERHLPPGALAPGRFARNVGVSVVRSSPIIGVGAVLLAFWYVLGETSLATSAIELGLRLIGGGAVAALLLANRDGSSRFRSGLGLDALVVRLLPDGRFSERVLVAWIVVVILVVAALWLTPDPFPLP